MTLFLRARAVFLPLLLLTSALWSQEGESEPEPEVTVRMPVLEVIGEAEGSFESVPGSGEILGQDTLLRLQPMAVQDLLRDVPGVYVRRENASGAIANIGVRGLNPDRSEKLLMLEDGVPISMSNYNSNALYYVPLIDRIDHVEVLKGSGSILFGPQTVGGVINLITPEIPQDPGGFILGQIGMDDLYKGVGMFGGTWGQLGAQISAAFVTGDGFRDPNDFTVTDLTGKFRFDFTADTSITWKGTYYETEATDTYLGLTRDVFAATPYANPAIHDRYEVRAWLQQTTLQHFFGDSAEILVNFYSSHNERPWDRQDFRRNTGFVRAPSNTVAAIGDPDVDGGVVYLLSSFDTRDRDLDKVGIEPRLIFDWELFGKTHKAHMGFRYQWEEQDDRRVLRPTQSSPEQVRHRDIRNASAWAFFVQNEFAVTEDVSVIPGLRVESYEQSRHFRLVDFTPADLKTTTDNTEWIPGLGGTWRLFDDTTTVFAGVHRGFAPPRTSDAIARDGADQMLEAELSWNYEVGIRTAPTDWFAAEATWFLLDFTNQVVPANESGGASTFFTNAGETRNVGFELAGAVETLQFFAGDEPADHRLWIEGNYTYVETENVTRGGLFEGKELPYAPSHVGALGLRYECADLGGVGARASYSGSQFSDQANTVAVSADGLAGEIPGHWVVDLDAHVNVPGTPARVMLNLNNLFDETYVSSRAPRGTFPGTPFQALLGIRFDF